MKIRYFEKEGELWFSYEERVLTASKAYAQVYSVYESSDRIPKKVQKQGLEAIRKYTERKVKADIRKQKSKARRHDRFAKDPNFSVSVEYEGEILKGKIIQPKILFSEYA